MVKLIKADFNGQAIQFNDSGWFNATAVAKQFGKRIDHFLANEETKRYIEKLTTRNYGELMKTREGRGGGTWLHPKLGVFFARWLDLDFAIWCDEQIEEIIYGKPESADWKKLRHEAAASYKVMSSMLDINRKSQGKETDFRHYANEARLVNWAFCGDFGRVDRGSLSDKELSVIAKLEEMNALLIAQGVEREQRKAQLKALADSLQSLGIKVQNEA